MTMDNRDPVRALASQLFIGAQDLIYAVENKLPHEREIDRLRDACTAWAARAAISTPSSVDLTERSGEGVQAPLRGTERRG
jgi:hypothetical protein